jgi:hypothetical protein
MMPLLALEHSLDQVTTMLALESDPPFDMNISQSTTEKYRGMAALIWVLWEFCPKCMQL